MIPFLRFQKEFRPGGKAALTLLSLARALDVPFERADILFQSEYVAASARKCLKTIVNQFPQLKPYYGEAFPLKVPSGNEALRLGVQTVEFQLPASGQDFMSWMETLDGLLASHPPKAYKYSFYACFLPARFGQEAIAELSDAYRATLRSSYPALSTYTGAANPILKLVEKQMAWAASSHIAFSAHASRGQVAAYCLLDEGSAPSGASNAAPPLLDQWIRKFYAYKERDLKRGQILSSDEGLRTRQEVLAKAQFGAPPSGASASPEAPQMAAYLESLKAERQKTIESMQSFMLDLVRSGKLPHDIMQYHIKVEYVGGRNADGSPSIMMQYRPLECILIPQGQPRPARLDALGVRAEMAEEFVAQHKKLWESMPGGERPYDINAATHPGVLDGVEYRVLPLMRQPGIDRKKILNQFLKPAGYRQAKGLGTYEFQKILSDREMCGCSFDFGSWRQTVMASFSYTYSSVGKLLTLRLPFIYWSGVYPGTQNPRDIDISTERIFSMTVENVAFIAQALEKKFLPEFHGLIEKGGLG